MSFPSIIPAGASATAGWWEEVRRPELLRLFSEYVYGVTPPKIPDRMDFRIESARSGDPDVEASALTVKMEQNGHDCTFQADIYRPSGETATLPAIVMIDPFSRRSDLSECRFFPTSLLTRAGFTAVRARVDEACPDDPKSSRRGIMQVCPPDGASGWGAIGAWAFCASRVIDYLLTRRDIKPGGIAVCGCSRGGKAALWCGAQDPRITVTISSVSGCSGAAVSRNKGGERIADITKNFPHWFCPRYSGYADREEELPVDQHMLLALCAPRPLYVASASADDWADPAKEFESAWLCGDAYHLYGKRGLSDKKIPPLNVPLLTGDVGYHLREGKHGCEQYDWEQFLLFMRKYM